MKEFHKFDSGMINLKWYGLVMLELSLSTLWTQVAGSKEDAVPSVW